MFLPARCALAALILLLGAALPAHAEQSDATLWARIAQGMRIVDGEEPETVTWARYYANQPLRLQQTLERARPFLWYIVEATELRDMPLELALLPAVESGFDPQAHSPRRARGLWQFVPVTGKGFGLGENRHYDARRDVVASTRAALDYLQALNRKHGSWLLALAAYNVGSGALNQAIRSAGHDNFWRLRLPAETRAHVPRLLGIALLIQQPARFGVTLPDLSNRPAADMIYLERPVDLASAISAAGVASETLEQFNPGLKTLSDSSDKRVVLLPHEDAERLRAVLAASEYAPQPVREVEHVVAAGDSLWVIARHYKVSVAQLMQWNQLDAKTRLALGRRLRVVLDS